MPELPEVTALAAGLSRSLRSRVVFRVSMRSIAALKTFDPPLQALEGLRIDAVERTGKFVDIGLPPLHLVVHLARAGWIRHVEKPEPPKPSLKGPLVMSCALDDGSALSVTEQGTERRLAIHVVRALSDVPGIARLGIDALDPALDATALGVLLRSARGSLKAVLADQEVIAGIGNAYSDEILHAARLSPFRTASSLDEAETAVLWQAMRDVLDDAVQRAASLDLSSLRAEKKLRMRVHGRSGEPCPVCGDTVREVVFATRSLQYCPTCQTGGRVYADRRLSRLLR